MKIPFSFCGVAAVGLLALGKGEASAQIPAVGSELKLVIDGAWAPQLPSGAGPFGRLASPPNLEAKIATLAKSLNASSPKILPNLSGIAEAQRASMDATQADLGLKQNLRRAGGEALNSVAGFADRLRTKGDAIMTWNAVALHVQACASTTGGQPGPILGSRALSIVHLSMYDAYAGALGNPSTLPKYLPQLEAAPLAARASPQAAVAGAAYEALLRLYPKQKALLDTELLKYCSGVPLVALQPSLQFGAYVADAQLRQRASDPVSSIAVPFAQYNPPAVNVGAQYQPDPVTPKAPLYGPYYGATAPLFATTQRLGVDPVEGFAPLGSAFLAEQYVAVTTLGIASFLHETSPVNGVSYPRAARTPTENITGVYWGYDGQPLLSTPPRLYNQFVRKVAETKGNTEAQNARLFAFVNAGLADVGTLTWSVKYSQFYERPVTGVRAGRAGAALPGWLPLGSPTSNVVSSLQNWTPNFPSYPAGHGAFGTAAFQLVRLFYGVPAGAAGWGPDAVYSGTFVSEELNGATFSNSGVVRPLVLRGYKDGGLWKAILDNCNSRTFLGVHHTFDSFYPKDGNPLIPDLTKNVGALPLGLNVAENMWTAGAGLAPKFVGTPVSLLPMASPSAELPAPGSAPAAGSVDGGALYDPIPGIGGVSDTFAQPVEA